MKKKSYNPFKMWGSWIGAYSLGFVLALLDNDTANSAEHVANSLGWFFRGIESTGVLETNIIVLFAGFLVGWGIHSLIRRFK